MNRSPPGFSVHGILQARILERVAISFFRLLWFEGFSLWWFLFGAQALGIEGFCSCSSRAQELRQTGLVALRHGRSSLTRDRTHNSFIGR